MNSNQFTNNDLHQATPALSALSWTIACCWMLMFTTLSPPHRGVEIIGSLDIFAVTKVAIRVLVLLILIANLFFRWQRRGCFRSVRWFVPFVAFFGWAILSSAWSARPSVSMGQSISLGTLILVAISFSLYCRDMESVSRVLKHVTGSVILLCGVALFCYFAMPQIRALERYQIDGMLHATNAAATATLGLMLLACCFLIWNWRWAGVLLVPGIAVCSLVLLLALNRWAPLVTTPLLFVAFVCFSRRTLFYGTILAASAIGAIYLVADPGMLAVDTAVAATSETATRGQSFKEISALSGREILWDMMWESFDESPWIGHGYFVTSATGTMKVWNSENNMTAHNFLLQILVTSGIVGIVLFALAMLCPMIRIWFDLVQMRGSTSYAAFCGILGCWYVGWGVMNSSIAGPTQPESVIFFTLLGMGVGLVAAHRNEEAIA